MRRRRSSLGPLAGEIFHGLAKADAAALAVFYLVEDLGEARPPRQATRLGEKVLLQRLAATAGAVLEGGELIDVGARFRYTYDFGDDWHHEILVEDLFDAALDTRYPTLVATKGACPPEDCGGPWGYPNLREILAHPSHDEHRGMLEWLGLDDASEFDANAAPTDDREYDLALSAASR